MNVQPTEGLTKAYPGELERQIAASVPGMADFALGGPFCTTCGQCVHLDDRISKTYRPRRLAGCLKYFRMTGKHGDAVPHNTPSCKYFETR